MRQKFFSNHLDFFGFSASMLCAVHCIAIPVVMAVGAISGLAWLKNPWMEALFIALSFIIASWSLSRSYLLYRHSIIAIRIMAIGFAFIIISRFTEYAWEPILAAAGGITIATAHWKNWQLQKKCHPSH